MANDHRPRANISLVAGVIFAVVSSLLWAMLDSMQTRAEPTSVASFTGPQAAVTIVRAPTSLPSATPIPVTAEVSVLVAESSPTVQTMLPACGSIPQSWVSYKVRPGDTVLALSASSGATVDEIVQANCLDRNALIISSMEIHLPNIRPVREPCGPPPDWTVYTVQKGDTLYSLTKSRNTNVYAAMQANCFSSSNLNAGQQIYLPPLSIIVTETATAAPLPPPDSEPPSPRPTERPSATPVPVVTAQATPTSPASATPTMPAPTVTASSTATSSPTASSTATGMPSPTPTSTDTPSSTATSTATATAFATIAPTETSLPTMAPTATFTPTFTPTSTPTFTATATPSSTATPTGTATPTATTTPDTP